MFNFAQVSNRKIGKITFDVVTTEDHQSDLSITENPIESGAEIADHAVIQPKQVTINGVMVDHDHSGFGLDLPYVGNIRSGLDFLNHLPFPCAVVTRTAQTIAKARRLMSQATGMLQTVNKARQIAPFLPDFGLNQWIGSDGDNRVQKCYADLLACQKSGETIDIQTGIRLYQNMLIQSIGVNQSQDGSATFTITAREIIIVDTQTAQNSKISSAGKSKSGRAAIQSAVKAQQGTTQPAAQTPKKTSALFNIFKG